MRTVIITALILTSLAACNKADVAQTNAKQNGTKEQYFCPMHPQVRSDKPGVCSICQMDLVLPGHEHEMDAAHDSSAALLLNLDSRKQVLADVRTVEVRKERLDARIRASGTLVPSESAQRVISARVSGRVERLFVRQTGDRVKIGQALFELYSPALIQAQNDYLLALKSVAQAVVQDAQAQGLPNTHNASSPENLKKFSAKARERLLLLGMTEAQINAINTSGEAMTRLTVYSPFSGTVVQKNVIEGATVQEGASLFDLTDFSTVWNIADIYEQDAQAIRVGDRVTMTIAGYSGETFAGRIGFIYPTVNAETRTIKARIEVPNPRGILRPGMFTETEFSPNSAQALTVPEESVLISGTHAIVWVKEGTENGKGIFRAQAVRIGTRTSGKYAILAGLREGEEVAASGGFLLDSERQLRGGSIAEVGATPVEVPQSLVSQLNTLFSEYEALSEALVRSSHDATSEGAAKFVSLVQKIGMTSLGTSNNEAWKGFQASLVGEAKSVQAASTLAAQRKAYQRLSDALYKTLSAFKGTKKIYRAYCPMAFGDRGAYWLTSDRTIRNPYFGEEMLQCGEIRD
ncbi:MAG: efflux RND transporter periplasmic adaptor subunit [Candidatus Kapabacteria bacterium]|jgi:Cu(I)/Ag(I) efflux system membrane fusion protein|nr:efflux RND transporter periplasmic adaptor subunit [Candidatus Kapabacteria bacterium]